MRVSQRRPLPAGDRGPAGRARGGPGDGPDTGRDRGSILVLAPVGILILLLLATLTADGALAVLGQRQLSDALSAAAADAAGSGVDRAAFYDSGTVQLAPPAVGPAACASLAAQGDLHLHDVRVWVGVAGPVVTLLGRAEVDGIFGRAIPGFGRWQVAATATATAEQAPRVPPRRVAALTPLLC